jgi:hypothetical protein
MMTRTEKTLVIDAAVQRAWYAIEKEFLPKGRKYL